MYEGDEVEVALKQRLIGAATLFALAVIILPIFLDGSGDRVIREIPKPPLPGQPVDQPLVNQQAIPEPTKMAAVSVAPAASSDVDEITPEADKPPSTDAASESAEADISAQTADNTKVAEAPTEKPDITAASEKTKNGEADLAAAHSEESDSAPASQPSSQQDNQEKVAKEASSNTAKVPVVAATTEPQWIIQMASFAQEPKALALRDQLRSKGYKAFVENFDNQEAQTLYRVRVGPPRIQRDKAEAELQEIQEKIKMRGYIAKFP